MPKVSVIIPSLNVGGYIKECLESVINQTLQDIEIICVDAGSTDGTLELIQAFAVRDERIMVIVSDRKSYGYQMNLGLQAACGEYVGIVESDDYIVPEMYEELYDVAVVQQADFVKADFDTFITGEDGNKLFLRYPLSKYSSAKYHQLFSSKDYVQNKTTMDIFIWNGIYNKEFLKKNNILFNETPGAAFQDCGFRYQVALCVERGYFIDKSYYRYRRDNVCSSTYNAKCIEFNLAECKYLMAVVEEKGIVDRLSLEFLAREMFVIAHCPYIELLQWKEPSEGSKLAIEEFRKIFKTFIERGLLSVESVSRQMWTDICIFVENPEFYEYYSHLIADIGAKACRSFVEALKQQKQVVIFGSGLLGSSAYCMLQTNKLDNIVAFADNDSSKWETEYMGCVVKNPAVLVENYPEAYFLIANARYTAEIEKQLEAYGVAAERIGKYEMGSSPLECTNMFMTI